MKHENESEEKEKEKEEPSLVKSKSFAVAPRKHIGEEVALEGEKVNDYDHSKRVEWDRRQEIS
jgi:hypothetical protein